ncbi:MAG: molybdopterin-dependent oxidoreductase, partial [Bacteroidota bacterium]
EGAIFFLGSPNASMESNFALRALANQLGQKKVRYVPHVIPGMDDGFLRKDDRTPNSTGCEALGFEAIELEVLHREIMNGDIQFLYMLEDRHVQEGIADALEKLTVIVHATNHSTGLEHADVVLPAAMEIEAESTYINLDGLAQVTKMAKQIQQMTPDMWMRIPKSRLDKAAVAVDRWRNVDNIYDVLPSWRMIAMVGKELNIDLPWKTHKDIFGKVKASVEQMRDLNVSYKVPKEAFKFTQFDFAIR